MSSMHTGIILSANLQNRISNLLTGVDGTVKPKATDNRLFINRALWTLRT